MSKAARIVSGSVIGLTTLSRVGVAQQANPYQLSGQEMVFILMLVLFVIGGWVWYEWIRKSKAS
ncbi:MAG: hypothetical protein ACK4HB_00340 [Candidatus Bipolaricaulia bacterium]